MTETDLELKERLERIIQAASKAKQEAEAVQYLAMSAGARGHYGKQEKDRILREIGERAEEFLEVFAKPLYEVVGTLLTSQSREGNR